MSYATLADLQERFSEIELVQLTDRNNVGVLDTAVVAAKLADADGEIDGYLRGRYLLPLSTIPQPLVRIACDIARYHLYDDRATEQVTKRYNDAINFLKLLSKGDVQLGLDGAQQTTAVSGLPEVCAPDRVFTTDSLGDY